MSTLKTFWFRFQSGTQIPTKQHESDDIKYKPVLTKLSAFPDLHQIPSEPCRGDWLNAIPLLTAVTLSDNDS